MTALGGLIQNASLLLGLVLAYSLFIERLPRGHSTTKAVQGVLFGLVALIGMAYPVTLAPGVIFDARTAVIAMAGVFAGFIPTAIATLIAVAFRAWIGGPGAEVGIAIVLTTAALGLGFGHLRHAAKLTVNARTLAALGLLVHLASVLWFMMLPEPVRTEVLRQIALPYLIVLPAVTVLLGLLLRMQEQRDEDARALRESQTRLIEAQRIAGIGDWQWDLRSSRQDGSAEQHSIYGGERVIPSTPFSARSDLYSTETWPTLKAAIEATRALGEPLACDAEIVRPDASRRWVTVRGEPVRDTSGRITQLRGTVEDITERKAATDALAHERAFLATLIQTIPDLVWMKDPDGVYLACNRRFEQFFGAPAQEILGRTDRDFRSEEEAASFRRHDLNALTADGPTKNEETITFAEDGHQELLETIKTPLRDGNGQVIGVLGVARNIGPQREAQQALQRERDRFQQLLETVDATIVALDNDDRITLINRAGCEALGCQADELTGGDWFELSTASGADARAARKAYRSRIDGDGTSTSPWSSTVRGRAGADRTLIWRARALHNDAGAVVGGLLVGQDVTEQQKLQQRLNDFAEHVPGAIYQYQQWPDGRTALPYASQGLTDLFGLDPAEMTDDATPLFERMHPDDVDRIRAAALHSMQHLEPYEERYRVCPPDGRTIWIEAKSSPEAQPDGSVIWHGYVHDITEQEELHQRIEKIAEHVPGMIYQYQLWPDGRAAFPYASQGIKAIYGVEPADVVDDASRVFEALHPNDVERVKLSITRSVQTLEPWQARCRVRFDDGRTIWVEGESSPEPQADGSILWHGYIHDVTDAMRSEQRLRESQQKLLQAQYAARMGDFEWDITTGKISWSDGMYHLLGWDRGDEIDIATVNSRVHHPDDLARVTQWLQDAIDSDSNELAPNEYRLLRKDGSIIEVQVRGWFIREGGVATRLFGIALDISERKQAETQLRLAASVFEHSREGIVITDAANRVLDINPGFTRITGYDKAKALGQNPKLLASGRHDHAFYKRMWQALKEDGFWQGEIWNRREGGEIYPEMLSISAVQDANGELQNYIGVFSDISQLKAHEAELDRIARFDPLTGIPNRRLLTDRLQQALNQNRRTNRIVAVCYLDLDGFKALNDRFGHAIGDQLLINITRALREALREEDTVARLGGDEFVVLLTDLSRPDDCVGFLNRILLEIRKVTPSAEITQGVSASIGVTLCPPDQSDPDALLRHADQAMYRAKESGKNTYHLYDAEQDRVMQARRSQREQLRRALENRELRLWYQPQVNLISREVIRVEALLRWQHPQQGLLLPGAFLPNIEGTELEIAVGDWVVDAAIDQQMKWLREGQHLPISINIGANQLLRPDFFDRLMQKFSEHRGSRTRGFELEILESAALSDFEQAMLILADCKAVGLQIALDDFGTGYSSLAYLRRLPVDQIKIDQAFVRDMLEDPDDLEIVQSVIQLATSLGRTVIAEGVETLGHAAQLAWLGCRQGQGFGIARPMPAAELPSWIEQWTAQGGWPEPELEPSQRHPELPVLIAAQNHRFWLHQFNAKVAKADFRGLEEEEFAAEHCLFYYWQRGAGAERFGELVEFRVVRRAHAKVHQLAAALASDLRKSGRLASHNESMVEIRRASDDLIFSLEQLINRIGPTARSRAGQPSP